MGSGGKKRPRSAALRREREGGRGCGVHVTKCILITEQQMSCTEPLCWLNSRTPLHFSGLTSHCIHLAASCQFRGEREFGGRRKRKETERL